MAPVNLFPMPSVMVGNTAWPAGSEIAYLVDVFTGRVADRINTGAPPPVLQIRSSGRLPEFAWELLGATFTIEVENASPLMFAVLNLQLRDRLLWRSGTSDRHLGGAESLLYYGWSRTTSTAPPFVTVNIGLPRAYAVLPQTPIYFSLIGLNGDGVARTIIAGAHLWWAPLE